MLLEVEHMIDCAAVHNMAGKAVGQVVVHMGAEKAAGLVDDHRAADHGSGMGQAVRRLAAHTAAAAVDHDLEAVLEEHLAAVRLAVAAVVAANEEVGGQAVADHMRVVAAGHMVVET